MVTMTSRAAVTRQGASARCHVKVANGFEATTIPQLRPIWRATQRRARGPMLTGIRTAPADESGEADE